MSPELLKALIGASLLVVGQAVALMVLCIGIWRQCVTRKANGFSSDASDVVVALSSLGFAGFTIGVTLLLFFGGPVDAFCNWLCP